MARPSDPDRAIALSALAVVLWLAVVFSAGVWVATHWSSNAGWLVLGVLVLALWVTRAALHS